MTRPVSTLSARLATYFTSKDKFWYVAALNMNVDSDIIVDNSLRCMKVASDFKVIAKYISSQNNMMVKKGVIFTVIKTPLYVPEGTQVHVDKASGIINTDSPLWSPLSQYAIGVFDASSLSDHELQTIKTFINNPSR